MEKREMIPCDQCEETFDCLEELFEHLCKAGNK